MKAGRFMVRVSRWMARSLHELAARFERWSGAASTPPPAAPPLPDPALQALAERFPGAPEHWLRMVASRIGMNGAVAAVGASPAAPPQIPHGHQAAVNPAFQAVSRPPSGQPRFAAPVRRSRGWNWPFGFGRQRSSAADAVHFGGAATPVSSSDTIAGSPDLPQSSARPGLHFNHSGRSSRHEPRFPASVAARPSTAHAMDSGGTDEAPRFVPEFPEPASRRGAAAQHWPVLTQTARPASETIAAAMPSADRAFAPIGGEWQSGYQVRQPSELRNIWPDLPLSEMTIPDAQPHAGDGLARRSEQAAARWSA